MRNTSRTFLLIGGILAIISAFSLIITACVFFYLSSNANDEMLLDIFSPFFNGIPGNTDADKLVIIRSMLMGGGIGLFIVMVLSIILSIVCFTARNKKTTGPFVSVIIFSAFAGGVFSLLGGIFGLVANGIENKAKNQTPNDAQF